MSGFVVVRHPDIDTPGVIPLAALEHHVANGWQQVSDVRAEPSEFHLPDHPALPAAPQPEPELAPDAPDTDEEK